MSNARDKANIPALNFSSTGIDDNATSTAITIDSSERVGIGTSSPDNILMVSSDGASASAQPLSIVNPVRYGTNDSVELEFGMGRANDTNNLNFPIIGLKKEQQWQGTSTTVDASVIFKSVSNQTASERMRIDSSGKVGIATSSPIEKMTVNGAIVSTSGNSTFSTSGANRAILDFTSGGARLGHFRGATASGSGYVSVFVDSSVKMHINSSGNVGIGTSSPTQALSIASVSSTPGDYKGLAFQSGGTEVSYVRSNCTDGNNYFLTFGTFASGLAERMRIDSSGNVMTGTTNSAPAQDNVAGVSLRATNPSEFSQGGKQAVNLNRAANDGAIVSLRGDGTEVATLQVRSDFGIFQFGSLGTGIGGTSSHAWLPTSGNARVDNTISVGQASYRMTVVYATTGTINTSDQNEKQSIQSLTTAEMNVGKRLSSLIKTYKWNSSVEEKGDNARTHTGIIAQDVQQAFADEGLDATKYGLWCSDTWSIDADGETIENPEEITENNPTKTKLGIRYEQLLSFIQAYNDQRFTELEARITALETQP